MATALQTSPLYIPAILRQACELDGIPVEELLSQAVDAAEDDAAESGRPDEVEADQRQDPTLPLFDRNGLYVRHITEAEAQRLVNRDQAVAMMANGWDSTRRNDLPWISVRLVITRSVLEYSNAALDHHDAQAVAGELGDCAAAQASRAKLEAWPKIGDDRAPRVGVRPARSE